MVKIAPELVAAYAELLREDPPLLRLHKHLVAFCRDCLEQGLGAADIVGLHLSLVETAKLSGDQLPMSDTVLTMTLAIRTLVQQLESSRSELRELERAHGRLVELYRTKSRTLSMVAHDLSNYLVTSRILALSMIRDTHEDVIRERSRQLLKVYDDQEHLIANLLSIGKIEAGLPMHAQRVNLTAVILRCIEAARKMSEHGFTVTGPDLQVLAEEDKVRQVLENLVGNAVKFSPAGGKVEVLVSQDVAQAVVTVRDHGVGISAADLPHVFEPYFRSTDGQTQGTGLGLSIVKSLMQLLHGEVRIDSGPGGTTVQFTLPLASAMSRL